jgi:hypothetical protein
MPEAAGVARLANIGSTPADFQRSASLLNLLYGRQGRWRLLKAGLCPEKQLLPKKPLELSQRLPLASQIRALSRETKRGQGRHGNERRSCGKRCSKPQRRCLRTRVI